MALTATITLGPSLPSHLGPRSLGDYVSQYFPPTSVCGFIAGLQNVPMVCSTNEYCSVLDKSLFGCCKTAVPTNITTTSIGTYTNLSIFHDVTYTLNTLTQTSSWIQGTYSYGNCSYWAPTTCFNSANASRCTGSCTSSALVCSDPNFAYCATYTYDPFWDGYRHTTTDPVSASQSPIVSGLFCDTSSYAMAVLRDGSSFNPYYLTSSIPLPTAGAGPTSMYSASQSSVASTVPLPHITVTAGAANWRLEGWQFTSMVLASCLVSAFITLQVI